VKAFDVAVVGGGPGGYVAALRAALRGAKTALVERDRLGGTCLNVGCIPTKAMLHASALAHEVGRAAEFGLSAERPTVDGPAFMKRVAGVVDGLRKGVEALLKKRGVTVIRGTARLADRHTLTVETPEGAETVGAGAVILATGSRPARPGFAPWDSDRVWTTDEATTAADLPSSVLVVGGGVIGCEFATAYAELGIPTTVVEMLDRLVPTMDPDLAKVVLGSLKQRRVTVLTGARIVEMKAGRKAVEAVLEDGKRLEADRALVAVGRVPNVENLGLEEVGVALDGRVIRVDRTCRTSVEGIWAVGDCAATLQYAHLASRMGVVAADQATGHGETVMPKVVPQVVYTHPEIASVGLTEAEAREAGREVRVARFPLTALGMARAWGERTGEVKLVAEADDGEVLGASVVGPHASDLVMELALAIEAELTVEEVAAVIHPHPTFAEAVAEAAELWLGLPLHTTAG